MPKQSAFDHSVQRRALTAEVCAGAGAGPAKTGSQIASQANRLAGFSVYVVEVPRGRDCNQLTESCTTGRDRQHERPHTRPVAGASRLRERANPQAHP